MKPRRGEIQHRFADGEAAAAGVPFTYNQKDHSVEAIISMGSPVKRFYGTEVLQISRDAVDLSRLTEGGIPLLDHHNQSGIDNMLGRLTEAWFERGALVGRFRFNQTTEGKKAEGMVARGEISGVSAGYRVDQWLISDADGEEVDERDIKWDDELTFTATRWQLFEASLVGVPADASAAIRSLGGRSGELNNIMARMEARQRMHERQERYRSDHARAAARQRMIERIVMRK